MEREMAEIPVSVPNSGEEERRALVALAHLQGAIRRAAEWDESHYSAACELSEFIFRRRSPVVSECVDCGYVKTRFKSPPCPVYHSGAYIAGRRWNNERQET
jgi:hypothetical protein